MTVDQLPGQVREFANYLDGLLARLDQSSGWCGVFWQRDPEGMRACLDGREMPPWDVLESLLQDLAAEYGPAFAAEEQQRAAALHSAALRAHDRRPGGRDALGDRLDVMLREQKYAAERLAALHHALASATPESADALRVDLAWARDDHVRAAARCAELRARMEELDQPAVHRRSAVERGPVLWPGGGVTAEGAATPSGPGRAEGGRPGEGPAVTAVPGEAEADAYGVGRPVDTGPEGPADHPQAAAPGHAAHRGPGAVQAAPGPAAHGGPGAIQTAPSSAAHPAPEAIQTAAPEAIQTAPAPQAMQAAPEPGKPRKRRRGGARFAGMGAEEGAAAVVPPGGGMPELPAPAGRDRRTPRGARFAGAADEPQPVRAAVDENTRAEVVEAVDALERLRGQGRSGEAHAVLVEAAHWPAARFPLLAAELERAGLAADWATLLWETASLPADRLVEAADALVAAGRGADGRQVLRQGVVRPADEIGQAVAALEAAGRRSGVRALLDAYVRVRAPEEAARSAHADPRTLVPLLLEAARGVSAERYRDLLHALRVAGLAA
ncbi:hypothetical protein [Streptomyces sp. NPDC053367]|uniref:hypothetical protein n=1 Tax=Streptomyces sp. NPDC053367 TaxID=3365700 RepID=UPI0037D4C389